MLRLAVDAMATRFELVLDGPDEVELRAAGEAVVERIVEVDEQLSRYRRDSFTSHLVRAASVRPVRVDEELWALLALCERVRRESDGAFDVTHGSPGELVLDADTRTVALSEPGTRLDFGAIGKGWALDRGVELLREHGVRRALVHGGTSTVHTIGAPPGLGAWRVAVAGTDREVELRDRALSVSAQHGRVLDDGGGHVRDPETGRAADSALPVAVVAPSAAVADAWSTALLVRNGRPLSSPPPVELVA